MEWAGWVGRVRDRGRVPGKRRTRTVLPVPCDVLRRIGGKRRSDGADGHSCDVLLARLATSQSGAVGRKQLLALGFTSDEIDHRLETRRLLPVHRGVYAVGHEALSDRGRCIAALLAAGPGAVLSHRTALALWKLIPSMPQLIEVTLTLKKTAPAGRHEDPSRAADRDDGPRRPPDLRPPPRPSRTSRTAVRPRKPSTAA